MGFFLLHLYLSSISVDTVITSEYTQTELENMGLVAYTCDKITWSFLLYYRTDSISGHI